MDEDRENIEQLIEIELLYARLEQKLAGDPAAPKRALRHLLNAITLMCEHARHGSMQLDAVEQVGRAHAGPSAHARAANANDRLWSPSRQTDTRSAPAPGVGDGDDAIVRVKWGQGIVERQLAIINRLHEAGLPTEDATRLLDTFARSAELVSSYSEKALVRSSRTRG